MENMANQIVNGLNCARPRERLIQTDYAVFAAAATGAGASAGEPLKIEVPLRNSCATVSLVRRIRRITITAPTRL